MFFFFFFNDTATTEIYTLSLHDALPIFRAGAKRRCTTISWFVIHALALSWGAENRIDRKSTRLNSSHSQISYAVFCLKKKNCCTPTDRHLTTLLTQCLSHAKCRLTVHTF